ncbi:uncharacterized protein MELLADRAFT_113093 [Melampsora larici-populina 98AG31]|uniref:DEAD/DEAH box helicase domain-containing protein n=1 Tax=Melampsora larici-populina (strain 98AG31 / pathotype 3-4-7) TaxID=747676 RepID=F4S8Q0_MELLP|nr:uncharacterized protein MELLADRAFT_113093 [Melampsora larici-populina 98AG31]EGF98986.1 hypothetical protein MELLADRAFT_113093 [Melampsora larici-populina 98AG31]
MLCRSHSATNAALMSQSQEERRLISLTAKPKLRDVYINTTEATHVLAVDEHFESHFGYRARPPQNKAIVDLINGCTSFLIAGTGFGKSHVPEMFYLAHDPKYSPVVLCINPLLSLGDDQAS